VVVAVTAEPRLPAVAGVALAAIPPALAEHPAFAPYAPLSADGAAADAGMASLMPRLVAPPTRALGALEFERRLVDANELIVRPNDLHDTLNALVWRRFPRMKRAISELHVALGAAATANARPRRRDVLTLFDEAGALLLSERTDLPALHAAHAWRALFVDRRAAFARDVRVILFGHGALEQLAGNAHRGLTVKALWVAYPGTIGLPALDAALAAQITAGTLLAADEPRLPLPLLGVPGWFAENEDPRCYDDASVFRPRRTERGAASS